jgi:metal-dependent amidase/aminoacylase/carboxypeptidase family protein
VGAALTLLPFVSEAGLDVLVVGTPAEEGFGSKRDLADAGVFDDVDACLLIYPGMHDIAASRTLFAQSYTLSFAGKAAHGAAHPELGCSALDALIAGYLGAALLRQTLPPEARIQTIITDGGRYPQVIPDEAKARAVVRGASRAEVADVAERVLACYRGAAAAHGAVLQIEQSERAALRLLQNTPLCEAFEWALRELNREPKPTDMQTGAWSTDAGYLSRVVPVLQPQIRMTGPEVPPHSHEFHAESVGPGAESAIATGALAMALTALRLAGDDELRARVRADFAQGLAQDEEC